MNVSKTEVKDPICGMSVEKTTAPHAERDGKTYYFCCDGCRKKFLSKDGPSKAEDEAGGCCG